MTIQMASPVLHFVTSFINPSATYSGVIKPNFFSTAEKDLFLILLFNIDYPNTYRSKVFVV